MTGVDPEPFSLNVNTLQLTRALKHLCKCEPRSRQAYLKYDSDSEMLTVSIGRSSRDVQATGTWIQPVSVGRKWLEALAESPIEAAITDLRQANGKLRTRDFTVSCNLEPWPDESEWLAKRKEDTAGAYQVLTRYKVAEREVHALVEEADSSTAQLWGSNDVLIEEIAFAWKPLAAHGVEPSDILRLIDRKSRDLWNGGRKAVTDLFGRYNVTEPEIRALVRSGDLAKAALWASHDARLIGDVTLAWKQLAIYGVEPSAIRRLIDRKSR